MDRINFKINDKQYSVGSEVTSDLSLLDFIRDKAELRGTKYMCREGGCGACIVAIAKCPGAHPVAVNSCLVLVQSCNDWEITTIEKLGNRLQGYHQIQKTLAKYNGTQCGYCTPGWVMAMHSLLQSKKDLTMIEIEQSFGSNICRCTGYRPILEAFKKFAKDAPENIDLVDIEDLNICKKTGKSCRSSSCSSDDWCLVTNNDVGKTVTKIKLADGKVWYTVEEIRDIFEILKKEGDDSYMLVAGNTGKGAYPIFEYPRVLVDISSICELKVYEVDQNLVIGGGVTLTELLEVFKTMSEKEYFKYLKRFYEHLKLVAHIAIRNLGTLAGNLMLKNHNKEFPSDLFLMLETVGAQLTIKSFGGLQTISMRQFLKTNMRGKVIVSALLPPLNNEYRIITYKIMPRAQNAIAIVNAGFLYRLDKANKVRSCRIVYGGLSPDFTRAEDTERFLTGKALFTNETLQGALKILSNEIVVVEHPPAPSAAYRKQLAMSLFYKSLLALCPDDILLSKYRSGAKSLRESQTLSGGRQTFDTNPSLWPLNQPVRKVDSLIQCSGEAKYSEDLPSIPTEVYAAFVLSTICVGTIETIDPSIALKQPGVITFYTAKDIPGVNSFTTVGSPYYPINEELLCNADVKYHSQPLGIIVATTRVIAERASKLVKVTYKNIQTPAIDVTQTKMDKDRVTLYKEVKAKHRGTEIDKVVKGNCTTRAQMHFTMETLVCITLPVEDGIEVYASTQWIDAVQVMISRALNMDENSITAHVRRLGGGYGLKISRATQVAVASSLVTHKLNLPCRFILPMTTVMKAVGKRLPTTIDFELGVNSTGLIQYADCAYYSDNGYTVNEPLLQLAEDIYNNCYDKSRWRYRSFDATTDTAKNTWCRSPCSLEHIAMAEHMMEQISYELGLDPVEVRLANLDTEKYSAIKEMIDTLKVNSDYEKRRAKVNKFNTENRWKKRGLRFAAMRWGHFFDQYFNLTLSVYHDDGTVNITHCGVEMGQGINTKAIQICAYFLGIPINKIQIKPNNTVIAPNGFTTSGSLTTQNIGMGVQKCCEALLERLKPIREQMDDPTWEELIKKAFEMNIDLQTHGFVNADDTVSYDIFGISLAEVEVDILTGEIEFLRVDIIQDVGQSVNPELDVGQVEGAFTMGLGFWTSEEVVYDEEGEQLTDRTWNYYVPLARDIAKDLRVYFRKNSYSDKRVLGAKATGEPSVCMSVAVTFAIREAISLARREIGIPTSQWFNIDAPYTCEKICLASCNRIEDFKLH